ncbi:MAG: hypothetical protein E5V72_25910, partial [Mesorhizobium sp.]
MGGGIFYILGRVACPASSRQSSPLRRHLPQPLGGSTRRCGHPGRDLSQADGLPQEAAAHGHLSARAAVRRARRRASLRRRRTVHHHPRPTGVVGMARQHPLPLRRARRSVDCQGRTLPGAIPMARCEGTSSSMNNEEKFMKAPHWYVIRPTFRGEIRCADEMKAAEIEHFLPMYGRWTLVRHTKGRRKEVRLPLLPGYLFGRLSGDDFTKLHDRRHFRHFDAIVKPLSAPRPVFVDDAKIEQLRAECEAGRFDQGKTRSGEGYLPGDRI